MSYLTKNLVRLNKLILKNAEKQFPLPEEKKKVQSRAMATAPSFITRPSAAPSMAAATLVAVEDLTASVDTEVVSGETRYCISTSTTGQTWDMNLKFQLNESVPSTPYVVLNFTQINGEIQEMIFESVTESNQGDNEYDAKLTLNKLDERDALLRALSNYDSQTTLVVAIKDDHSIHNTVTDPKIFYFATDYYPYIYKGIAPSPAVQELILHSYAYKNITYNYYQDNITKQNLFYLPDNFDVALDHEDNNKPMLSIYFEAPAGANSIDDVNVKFEYFLLPEVDQGRIAAAKAEFIKTQPDGIMLPLANPTSTSLFLELPDGKKKEPNALINLQSGISDSFTVSASKFGTVWDAFFNSAPQNQLMRGQVEVDLKGFNANYIPFKITLPENTKTDPQQFIEPGSPSTINRKVTFKSERSTFEGGPKPVKRIIVDAGGSTFELNIDNLDHETNYQVSILQILMGKGDDIKYKYNLQIYYQDGDQRTLKDQSSTFEIIYVP